MFSILLLTLLFLPANAQGSCGTPDNLQALVSGSEVSFSWTGTNDADIHVILLRNEQTGQNANAYSPVDASYTANNIPNGQYTWRVISICNTANTLDDHSEWVWGGMFTMSAECTSIPSIAIAGSDLFDVSGTSTSLNATAPTVGTGVWTIQSGAGGSIGNTNNSNSAFTGLAGAVYLLRWTVSNECGSSYDEVTVSFAPTSATDIDGNIYSVVKIGTQVWMGENLRVSKYNDGSTIPNVTDNTEWWNLTTGAWSYYDNNSTNNTTYGKLYNWYAVNTDKLCPDGWHIPIDAEWTVLTDYLGGAGDKMKTITGWNDGGNGDNSSGFSALPGGYRTHFGGFLYAGNSAYWWSSSMLYLGTNWIRKLNNNSEIIIDNNDTQEEGHSCRCIKNDCIAPPIEANGGVDQIDLTFLTTTLGANTPTDGVGIWSIESGTGGILLNADSANNTFAGTVGSTYVLRWTVTNDCGSIYDEVTVSFEEDASHLNPNLTYGSVSDIDGNSYATIQIGTQNWMAENLKVSKYNDGNTIPFITNQSEWNSTLTGAFAYFNNDDSHNALYGKFYNWQAVTTDKLCPTGWHIPTHAEWTVLTDYLGGTTIAGGKMKSVTGWNYINTGASNESGFTGLPAGYRGGRSASGLGTYGYWWSASEANTSDSYKRDLYYQNSNVGTGSEPKYYGHSCRCVED